MPGPSHPEGFPGERLTRHLTKPVFVGGFYHKLREPDGSLACGYCWWHGSAAPFAWVWLLPGALPRCLGLMGGADAVLGEIYGIMFGEGGEIVILEEI